VFDFLVNRTERMIPLPGGEPDLFGQRSIPPRGVSVIRGGESRPG
jgi:hypothetical protein